jgi:predicted DNA-binding protein (UPF0251 family)
LAYIGYTQAEDLLRKLPRLRTLLSGLENELRTLYVQGNEFMGSKEEILYSLAICNRVLTDMPFGSPSPGDKVNNIIANYEKDLARELRDTGKEISDEIILVSGAIKVIQDALFNLTTEEKEILRLKYMENKTWKELVRAFDIDEGTLKHKRRRAIEKMVEGGQLKIKTDQYQSCLKLLGVE